MRRLFGPRGGAAWGAFRRRRTCMWNQLAMITQRGRRTVRRNNDDGVGGGRKRKAKRRRGERAARPSIASTKKKQARRNHAIYAIVGITCCPRACRGAYRKGILLWFPRLREVLIARRIREFRRNRLCMCGRTTHHCEKIMGILTSSPSQPPRTW